MTAMCIIHLDPQLRDEKSHPDILFIGFPHSQVNFLRPVISPTNLNSKKEGLTWVWFMSGRRSMSLMTVWAPQ